MPAFRENTTTEIRSEIFRLLPNGQLCSEDYLEGRKGAYQNCSVLLRTATMHSHMHNRISSFYRWTDIKRSVWGVRVVLNYGRFVCLTFNSMYVFVHLLKELDGNYIKDSIRLSYN